MGYGELTEKSSGTPPVTYYMYSEYELFMNSSTYNRTYYNRSRRY
eukprot:COSAG02_NODE_5088_length_4644_cov_5.531353_1_plen_45_part_00